MRRGGLVMRGGTNEEGRDECWCQGQVGQPQL